MDGTESTNDGRFKVIIVGVGVCGLYLAHAFAKADIDYVVLDKHSVAPAWSSSISIYPSSSRILDQVGLYDVLDAKKAEMRDYHVRGPDGDVVIGCDGIHSAVRELLWERAHRLCPGLITVGAKQRITVTYTCLTGIAPYQPGGLGGTAMSSASHDGFSFLFLTQPDHVYFFVFIRNLPGEGRGDGSTCKGTSKYPNRLRFTEADADAVAARVLDCPVSETLVFGDV